MAAAATAAQLAAPARVEACGGLFCSASNPVNQAAEQIIFSDNGDGTVTAVIQILYEGPSHEFAWVLPIPGNPTVGVSSTQALDTLKQATNPTYQLNTVLGDGCNQFGSPSSAGGFGGASATPPPTAEPGDSGVSVIASGAIGPYVYDTIAVDPLRADPADTALDWLMANGYEVGTIGPDVLRPYLEDGLNLIAFKLSSTSDSGSIRPVMITYEATQPSIPIRPTAVAANDDMGVMVWLLSDVRGIPENYRALELNEALIDWFNPNNNYNDIVTLAADEASGQGFVTEFADRIDGTGTTGALIDVFPQFQKDTWAQFQSMTFTDPVQMVQQATNNWNGMDGLDEAFAAAVTLPDTITIDDFRNCMVCYLSEPGVVFNNTTYLQKLYELVIKPLLETQKLLDQRPYVTRLYTTMSAEEMTMDPVFAFNADLDDVTNRHVANRVIECKSGQDPFGAGTAWTVELAQGAVVHGNMPGVWPVDIESQPAALKILQYATEGQAEILEDRTDMIVDALSGLGGGASGAGGSGGSGGRAGSSSSTGGRGGSAAMGEEPPGSDAGEDSDAGVTGSGGGGDGGCSAARSGSASGSLWVLGLGLAALVRRRRAA